MGRAGVAGDGGGKGDLDTAVASKVKRFDRASQVFGRLALLPRWRAVVVLWRVGTYGSVDG